MFPKVTSCSFSNVVKIENLIWENFDFLYQPSKRNVRSCILVMSILPLSREEIDSSMKWGWVFILPRITLLSSVFCYKLSKLFDNQTFSFIINYKPSFQTSELHWTELKEITKLVVKVQGLARSFKDHSCVKLLA